MVVSAHRNDDPERRKDPRYPYSRYIFFATRNRFFQGDLQNYSRHGLCIRSPQPLPVGEVITVALPYIEDADEKRKGMIVWSDANGFGVELIRDRALDYV
jgi:hypothetical protein